MTGERAQKRALYKGAIFDLDGLLIDSEPIWRWAQVQTLKEAGGVLTNSMQLETTGLGLDAALKLWKIWFPGAALEKAGIQKKLEDLALGRILQDGKAQPGAEQTLEICRDAGCLLAVASSSSPRFIHAVLNRLGVEPLFRALVSSQEVEQGKPHPAVYLAAAHQLGLSPAECLAFEDSLHGLRSAKAAGMACIAVPAEHDRLHPGFAISDTLLTSLEDFLPRMLATR